MLIKGKTSSVEYGAIFLRRNIKTLQDLVDFIFFYISR